MKIKCDTFRYDGASPDLRTVQSHNITYHDDGTVTVEKNEWYDWYKKQSRGNSTGWELVDESVNKELASSDFEVDDERIRRVVE